MRRLLALLAVLPACRDPAHISVKLAMECQLPPSGSTQVQTCSDMGLECATHVEVRVYEALNGGELGNILESQCIPMASFGRPPPANLCDLETKQSPLLDSLPDGKTIRLRMRALFVNPGGSCNDDIPGQPPPVLLFDGFSQAVPIDGASHQATIMINQCFSCRDVQAACMNSGCPVVTCGPGQVPIAFPNSGNCCAVGCKNCDPKDPSCTQSNPCTGSTCAIPVGAHCADGTTAVVPAGQCCPYCPTCTDCQTGGPPTLRSSNSGIAASGASLSIAQPAGTTASDLLVATISNSSGSSFDVTPPPGWMLVQGTDHATGNGAGNYRIRAFYKVASAAEPSSYVFAAVGGPCDLAGGIYALSGANTTAPIVASAGTSNLIASPSAMVPAISVPVANTFLVSSVASLGGAAGYTEPAGWDQTWSRRTTLVGNEVANKTMSAAGTSAAHAVALSASARSVTFQIAIAPMP